LFEAILYRYLENRLVQHVREFLHRSYAVELPKIVVEQPPRVEFGEYALPLAFELANGFAKPRAKSPRRLSKASVRSKASKNLNLPARDTSMRG
jgi:arginyl-tRNA synthetase